jgi:hypothetical protein
MLRSFIDVSSFLKCPQFSTPHAISLLNISMLIQHQLKTNLSIKIFYGLKISLLFIFSLGQVTYSPIIMVPQNRVFTKLMF